MKNKSILFILLAIFALILSACAAPAMLQRVVELPNALVLLIEAGFVFMVGWAFAAIGQRLPWFTKLFGQYSDEIAYALSGAVIGAIQSWLNLIPPQWETVGNLALGLIVAVLAALQVFRLLGKTGMRAFRAQ